MPEGCRRRRSRSCSWSGFVFLLLQTVAELIKLGFVLGEKEQLAAPEIHEEPLRVE